MTIHLSRDYFPTSGSNSYTQYMYELTVFMYRVLGYSIVGHTAWDITSVRKQVNITGATNTSPMNLTTDVPHGFANRQNVTFGSVTNITNNSAWPIMVTGSNSFNVVSINSNSGASAGGTATGGFFYVGGLVTNNLGAGINFGAGFEKEVSIPISLRTVSAGDVGKMLVLKSNKYSTKNSGCFKISSVNIGANRYIIDYRSTENPPTETDTIDWWLYENDGIASTYLSTFQYNSSNSIQSATNASPIVITSNTHNLTTGQTVDIFNVAGNTAANGTWVVTVINQTTFSLNGSSGNGTFVGTGGPALRISGYSGSGLTPNSRIIMQSPHASGWQVRFAYEPSGTRLYLITTTVGYGGNSIGDFSIGGSHTHVYQYTNFSPTSNFDGLTVSAGNPSFTSRITIIGDDSGKHVGGYTISISASTANGVFSFGIPDNEPSPLPADNVERIYSYGSSGNSFVSGDFGNIGLKIGNQNNIGGAVKGNAPELCALSGWVNIEGSSNSPLSAVTAGILEILV